MLKINNVYLGDCLEVMKNLDDNSIDAIVTDPPYALTTTKRWKDATQFAQNQSDVGKRFSKGFMGKEWDGKLPGIEVWQECLRVSKPGAHILAFGGTRTHHRLMVAIEDAGWEIRDCIMWIYGAGFPKSLNVSKAIDRMHGAEREVIGTKATGGFKRMMEVNKEQGFRPDDYYPEGNQFTSNIPITEDAKLWDGWGTGLKPAWEPVILVRKAVESTVAENILKWGTGALNIGECTIGEDEIACHGGGINQDRIFGAGSGIPAIEKGSNPHQGRWPANLLLDEDSAIMLDEQSGELTSGENPHSRNSSITKNCYGTFIGQRICISKRGTDSGGASRFFYSSKANTEERNKYIPQGNKHPTVKPVDLMKYLCRLITPPGGVILDPFCGSGSTGVAAFEEGFNYILIDKDPESCKTARVRCAGKRLGDFR